MWRSIGAPRSISERRCQIDTPRVAADSLPDPDSSTGLRNLFYAIEWWVFGAFALFVWWRWAKDELERSRRGAPAGPGEH